MLTRAAKLTYVTWNSSFATYDPAPPSGLKFSFAQVSHILLGLDCDDNNKSLYAPPTGLNSFDSNGSMAFPLATPQNKNYIFCFNIY